MLEITGYGRPERPTIRRSRPLGDGKGYDLLLTKQATSFPWTGLAIADSDLSVNCVPGITGIECILHETDLNRSRSYRTLTAMIKQLKQRRRRIAAQLSKPVFDQVVKRRTSAFTQVIRKWDGGYLLKHSIKGSTWVWLEQKPGELLSKKKFLEAILKEPTLPARVRLNAQRTLKDISKHPEWDVEEYIQWVDVVAHVLVDNTWNWFLRLVPRTQLVRVPMRDWARIRQDWLRHRIRVQKELEEVDTALLRLENRRAPYALHRNLQYHRMCHYGTAHSMVLHGTFRTVTDRGRNHETSIAFDPSHNWFGASTTLCADVSNSTLHDGWKIRVGYVADADPIRSLDAEYLHNLAQAAATYTLDESERWERLVQDMSSYSLAVSTKCEQFESRPRTYVLTSYRSDPSSMYPEQTMELDWIAKRVPDQPTIIDLDKHEGLDLQELFEEKRLVAIKRLLALDLGRGSDALTFNVSRSVGELKDTPQTLRTGLDFLRWCKTWRGKEYYEIHTPNGVRICTPTSRDILSRVARQTATSQGRRSVVKSSRLTALGITKVVRRKVGLLTNAAMLASVYLAWKFGISQTLADTNTVLHSGWRFACSVRRGLGQLLSHLHSAKELHPIRRMWRCRSSHLPRNMKFGSYMERDFPRPHEFSVTDRVDLSPYWEADFGDGYFRGQNTIPGHSEWRVVTSEMGLWFADPYWVGKTDGPGYEYYLAIREHNQQVIADWIRERGGQSYIFTRNDMRGVVFAKFSWRSLLKAVRGGWNNLNARLKSFTTAWELAPLSFVVEWFSNIRTLVDSAQALIEKTEAKVAPVGKPWEMLSSRLWIGHLELDVNGTVDCEVSRIGMISFYGARQVESSYHESNASIRLVPTELTYTFNYRFDTPSEVSMSRTQIRRAIRRPYDGAVDELPAFKVRLNLNVGKLGSLLAMVMQKLK